MKSSQYEALFNNESILVNAVRFTTAHRAFIARLIPLEDLNKLSQQSLDFLTTLATQTTWCN